ncbi:Xylan 1,4-beta-xylosidase precursor [compost metagenome]
MKRIAILVVGTLLPVVLRAQDCKTYPMWNHTLSVEKRVKDLIGRLSLEEKVGQMLNAAPAIPRLGIPAYEWWNYGLSYSTFHYLHIKAPLQLNTSNVFQHSIMITK